MFRLQMPDHALWGGIQLQQDQFGSQRFLAYGASLEIRPWTFSAAFVNAPLIGNEGLGRVEYRLSESPIFLFTEAHRAILQRLITEAWTYSTGVGGIDVGWFDLTISLAYTGTTQVTLERSGLAVTAMFPKDGTSPTFQFGYGSTFTILAPSLSH